MNCPATPLGGGSGMKCKNPFRPKTRKITPMRYRAIAEIVFITGPPLGLTAVNVGVNYLDVNRLDDVYFLKIQILYGPRHEGFRSRLAGYDEGHARADALRSGRYCRYRPRNLGVRRA